MATLSLAADLGPGQPRKQRGKSSIQHWSTSSVAAPTSSSAAWARRPAGTSSSKFGDREETYETGDAYYVPPGHVPLAFERSEILQFQPADELAKTKEVMARNMQAAGAPG